MFILKLLQIMKIKTNKKRGFSIPEVIVAISIVTLIIMTATNLLVSSMRANRNNVKANWQMTDYNTISLEKIFVNR